MKLTELLKDAKRNAPNLMTQELFQGFEEFLGILVKGGEDFEEKLNASHDLLQGHFMKVAAHYGMTAEQLTEFVSDANNFDSADWEEIQANKRIILDNFEKGKK